MKQLGKFCCECKHFRMWKPMEQYCTVKKEPVEPLKRDEHCYVTRKGLRDLFTGRLLNG